MIYTDGTPTAASGNATHRSQPKVKPATKPFTLYRDGEELAVDIDIDGRQWALLTIDDVIVGSWQSDDGVVILNKWVAGRETYTRPLYNR